MPEREQAVGASPAGNALEGRFGAASLNVSVGGAGFSRYRDRSAAVWGLPN